MMYGRSLAIGGCFLALVILLSALIFYLSLGPCPSSTFACDNGELCVPQRQKCDSIIDCPDGSDEDPIDCGILYGSKELTDKIVRQQRKQRKQQLQQQQQQQENQQQQYENESKERVTSSGQQEILERMRVKQNEGRQQQTDATGGISTNNNNNNISTHTAVLEADGGGGGGTGAATDGDGDVDADDDGSDDGKGDADDDVIIVVGIDDGKADGTADDDDGRAVAGGRGDSTGDNDGGGGRAVDGRNAIAAINNGTLKATKICEISTYPTNCICDMMRTILYCNERAGLTQIPKELTAKVTNLIIHNSNLTLNAHAFAHLMHLERISLKYDNISHLPVGTFAGLRRLKRLNLSHNNLTRLADGVLDDLPALEWLFLQSNQLYDLPLALLAGVPQLEWLVMSENLLTLHNESFPSMDALRELSLDFNRIESVSEHTFEQLNNLHLLNLNGNHITYIHPHAFWGLWNISDIRLANNPIKTLNDDTFLYNPRLDALSLGHTSLWLNRNLLQPLNVSYLNLTGIRFEQIDFDAINGIQKLKYIIFDHFYFCSMTPMLHVCKPNTDGVSTFRDLLSKPVLRYSAWIMATITLFGNMLVLWGRFIYRDENLAVTMVIRNLALADILMGFYLLTIGTQDYRFRNEYHKVASEWIRSWQCVAAGTLAVTSSEVSMLILAFMSLERFLLIADPFRGHLRIGLRNIFTALLAIWCMGVGIAVAPIVVWWRSTTNFYSTYSGTCFPLHIQEAFPVGWQYSAFMFLGINLFLLLMIALLYTALLISIWRTRKATPLSLLDCEFAVRFFFIVLTDVLCWAPIIAVKIWVFFNYNISDDIYAWLVVFILPLNSAVNPLLYTFTTPKYRNQILLRGWKKITAKRRPAEPGMMATTTIATATGSSNPDDSSGGRAIPLVVSH